MTIVSTQKHIDRTSFLEVWQQRHGTAYMTIARCLYCIKYFHGMLGLKPMNMKTYLIGDHVKQR
jgi:hypothetical protein